MINLLSEQEKKSIRYEYRIRLITVICAFGCVSFISGIIFMFPSYIYSTIKLHDATAEATSLNTDSVHNKITGYENELQRATDVTSVLQVNSTVLPISKLISIIITDKGKDNKITDIGYTRGTKLTMSILGVASTRESLVSFTQRLQAENLFNDVQLPVSNFAKNKDIPFSFSLTGK